MVDTQKVRTNLTVMLGTDDLQLDVLDIIIENVMNHLKSLLGKDVPEKLQFIVEEVSIRRYNRIGSEGMKSESVEGHAISFYDLADEFTPYQKIIDDERDDGGVSRRGRVMFF